MINYLLVRYILNSPKRVEAVSRFNLDVELIDIEGFFSGLLTKFGTDTYPLTKAMLITEYPQYKEVFNQLPDELNMEEENYSRSEYEDRIGNKIVFSTIPTKKENKKFYRIISDKIAELEDEINQNSDEEMEFDTTNMWMRMDRNKKTISGIIPTPFPKLNAQIGGFLPGRLYAFEAPPKSGKSTLMVYIAFKLAKEGYKVYYISTEMPELEVSEILFSMMQGEMDPITRPKSYMTLTTEEGEQICKSQFNKGVVYYRFFTPQVTTMKSIAKYLENKEYDLLIIDHASNNHVVPNYFMKNEKEFEAEKRVYGDIFSFARTSFKPILLPTFINRSGTQNIEQKGFAERFFTAGTFSKNAIVDGMWAVVPRSDKATGDYWHTDLAPMYLRRKLLGGDQGDIISLEISKHNLLWHEVITVEDSKKEAQPSYERYRRNE